MSEEEYFSTSDDESFDIFSNVIDKKDDDTLLLKISFIHLNHYFKNWCFNREVNNEKINEIYESLKVSYSIPFVMHAVFDQSRSDNKFLLIDGQHRYNAIDLLRKSVDYLDYDSYNVWIWIYKIDKAESDNVSKVVDIFKKINNNRIFNDAELPDLFIIDLVNAIANVPAFKKSKVIGDNDKRNICHHPCIHKKQLNAYFNSNKDLIIKSKKNINDLVSNILIINHKLGLKKYEEMYIGKNRNKTTLDKWNKAVSKNFFLNLKDSNYTPEIWIKFITDASIL